MLMRAVQIQEDEDRRNAIENEKNKSNAPRCEWQWKQNYEQPQQPFTPPVSPIVFALQHHTSSQIHKNLRAMATTPDYTTSRLLQNLRRRLRLRRGARRGRCAWPRRSIGLRRRVRRRRCAWLRRGIGLGAHGEGDAAGGVCLHRGFEIELRKRNRIFGAVGRLVSQLAVGHPKIRDGVNAAVG